MKTGPWRPQELLRTLVFKTYDQLHVPLVFIHILCPWIAQVTEMKPMGFIPLSVSATPGHDGYRALEATFSHS